MKEMTLMKLRKVSIVETAKDQVMHLSGAYSGPEGPVPLCVCAFFFFSEDEILLSPLITRDLDL